MVRLRPSCPCWNRTSDHATHHHTAYQMAWVEHHMYNFHILEQHSIQQFDLNNTPGWDTMLGVYGGKTAYTLTLHRVRSPLHINMGHISGHLRSKDCTQRTTFWQQAGRDWKLRF